MQTHTAGFVIADKADCRVIAMRGILTAEAGIWLQEDVKKELTRGLAFLVIDLTGVTRLPTTAIGRLLVIDGLCRKYACRMMLVNAGPEIRSILSLIGLDREMAVFDSYEEVLRAAHVPFFRRRGTARQAETDAPRG